MSTLLDLKSDAALLLKTLGLERAGSNGACRFCSDRTALSTFRREDGWAFRCHKCGAAGDVISAIALSENISPGAAIRRLCVDGPMPFPKQRSRPEAPTPVIEAERAFRLFHTALLTLLSGGADKFLAKRGIRKDWIYRAPALGFIQHANIAGWKRPLCNAWVIRVATASGDCVALKIHRESPAEGCPKSGWLPFGTQPADAPRHGFATLWPPPEWFPHEVPLVIVEGELKAARVCSFGLAATSPTTGSSFKWTPAVVARVAGRHVRIIADPDDAGHKFCSRTVDALRGQVATLKVMVPDQEN